MIGQTVCRMHGGMIPAARENGRRRAELAKALGDNKELIAHIEGEGVTDPLGQLARLAEEAIAMKNALARRVNAIESLRYEDDKGSEQLRSEIVLYERALDRSARFVEILAKSGFEEARTRIQIQQGQLVSLLIRRVLDALQLTDEQRTIAGTVVPNELRRLGAGLEEPR